MAQDNNHKPQVASLRVDDHTIQCSGAWTVMHLHGLERQIHGLHWPAAESIHFDLHDVSGMDTAGAWVLRRSMLQLEQSGRAVTVGGLTPEAETLLELVVDTGAGPGSVVKPPHVGMLEGVGRASAGHMAEHVGLIAFVGEMALAALPLIINPFRGRWRMVLHELAEAGYKAMPIVGLLSFLLGVVIAYQGGVQLRLYGASVFIADLVGISMLRELAPMITAIIIAGRTGSAYTAQIGTMKVTEEVDAMRTMGIEPMDMLVLPKVLGLAIALPLLTIYADIMGVLGGMVMSSAMLGVSPITFTDRLSVAVSITTIMIGIGKAPVFALIVATVGCYQGFLVAGSAESVGRRTTISVVQSILLVIVIDAVFSVLFSKLGI